MNEAGAICTGQLRDRMYSLGSMDYDQNRSHIKTHRAYVLSAIDES